MGFFLLRRDGDAVTLIAETVFDSRHEALAEVSRASAEGTLDADEVFVVDLDAATPVLIVSPPPAAVESEAPDAPERVVEEEPAGDAPNDNPDTMIPTAPVELVEEPIAAAVLADAEAESLSEPPVEELESVEIPEPESAAPEPEEPEDIGVQVADSSESLESMAEQPESSESPEPEPTPETVVRTWPWEPVPAPMDAPEDGAEHGGVTGDAADEADTRDDEADAAPEEEPDHEVPANELTDDEEADELPAEVSGLLADLEELAPTPPVEDRGKTEPDDLDEAELSEPHTVDQSVQMADPVEEPEPAVESEALLASGDADGEPTAEPTIPKAYEAGASDITMLTCDDCIYLNTCPKKGESDPTSCGSFQWKSV